MWWEEKLRLGKIYDGNINALRNALQVKNGLGAMEVFLSMSASCGSACSEADGCSFRVTVECFHFTYMCYNCLFVSR